MTSNINSTNLISKDVIAQIIKDLDDVRDNTLALVNGLDAQQIIGPKLDTINPLLWEIGHVAYFYEFWILRHLDKQTSFLKNADELYDSINIAHSTRWDLPLLSLKETLNYMQQVKDAVANRLHNKDITDQDIYLTRYAIFHENMHTEAFTYTRVTLDYPKPIFNKVSDKMKHRVMDLAIGDAHIPAQEYQLGADPINGFCFDNAKWQHTVNLDAFSISRTATSNKQYADFVSAGGYENKCFWSEDGWKWLQESKLKSPIYWRKDVKNQWQERYFDSWVALEDDNAVIHISWFEAMAWCQWAGRRLPTEAEWELAASGSEKKTFPWGNAKPKQSLANMNFEQLKTINVHALSESDSDYGCRQMIGNVWEWTADTFNPYPQFTPDMYEDFSQPLFGITRVLRGGAWTTNSRMIHNTWRNYYGENRNDIFAGFRSCAIT